MIVCLILVTIALNQASLEYVDCSISQSRNVEINSRAAGIFAMILRNVELCRLFFNGSRSDSMDHYRRILHSDPKVIIHGCRREGS